MKHVLLEHLNAARDAGRPVALVTDMEGGSQALIYANGNGEGESFPPEVVSSAQTAIAADKSGPAEIEGGSYFVHVHNPPLRLIVVGAVHITQALVGIAQIAGYAVTVIDPRRAFADAARFPNLEVSTEWPDDALKRLEPDGRTAIVTLSHDPKIDDPALEVALRSKAFYVGSLGSKRTHGKRLTRLEEMDFSEAEMDRIHAPIGLDIGAKSPAEIAVSIVAQITQVRQKPRPVAPGKAV